MRKWIAYAVVLVFAASALASFQLLKAPSEKDGIQAPDMCADFTDYAGCKDAIKTWEGRMEGGEVYAVVEYRNDGKSVFEEGWILYMRLDNPMGIPGANETTYMIGILADKNSNASQIYEFVK